MEIYQIIAIGIVSAILSLTIKKESPAFGIIISVIASVLIFMMIAPKLSIVINLLTEISQSVTTSIPYVITVVKIIGIAYLCEFGSQICADAGESSIASKIELAGKVVIFTLSAPIIFALVKQVFDLI